jgi:2,4-dienoyl-CoA reductase-like NADH-dependent reductase (Old Yellow Enzyme family)
MSSALFSPTTVGSTELPNRIVVSPMCQYSADDGCANDWHLMHLMQLGISGAGLIVLEATAIERRARITHGCLGLYNDANEAALARVMVAARRVAPQQTRWGIQINHAGRKASAQRPWEGRGALTASEDGRRKGHLRWLQAATGILRRR